MRELGCFWAVVRFTCFIALALHLGWSWWLIALVIVLVEVTFTPRA